MTDGDREASEPGEGSASGTEPESAKPRTRLTPLTQPAMSGVHEAATVPSLSEAFGSDPRASVPGLVGVDDPTSDRGASLPRSRPSQKSLDLCGTVLGGRYRLLRVLGEGGMGTVYEAEHVEIERHVAIKVLNALPRRRAEATKRFMQEARATSRIESEHVVGVFDVGDDERAGLYMVMELLRGEDLEHVLAEGGPLDERTVLAIAYQASLGLERAHEAGIIHRDLKPANVFLSRVDDDAYRAKLVDFGIAKLVRDTAFGDNGITQGNVAVGTPQYMSPEQASGEEVLDPRSDLYSLGAVLFEALTAKPVVPSLRSYEATILHILANVPVRVTTLAPRVSAATETLLADLLERDPTSRIASAKELKSRLLAIDPKVATTRIALGTRASRGSVPPATASAGTLDGAARRAGRVPPDTEPGGRVRGRKRRALGLAGIVFAAMVTGGFLATTFRGAGTSKPEDAPSSPASKSAPNGRTIRRPSSATAIGTSPWTPPTEPATSAVEVPSAPSAVPSAVPSSSLAPAASAAAARPVPKPKPRIDADASTIRTAPTAPASSAAPPEPLAPAHDEATP
ncbi:MAG: serine/threonine-protein kinase [Polyangiaceae bacterium]